MADAVAGSVQIVDAGIPQGFAGESVDQAAPYTCGKFAFGNSDSAFQGAGKVLLHLLARLVAKGDRTGDVGRSVQILGSGVEQVQTVRFQLRVRFGCRRIVYDRSVRTVAGYAGKAVHDILGLFGAQSRQLGSGTQLRHLFSGFKHLFQPEVEFGHGDAVFQDGVAESFYLCLVLDAFQVIGGRGSFYQDTAFGQCIVDGYVGPFTVDEHPCPFRQP